MPNVIESLKVKIFKIFLEIVKRDMKNELLINNCDYMKNEEKHYKFSAVNF